MADLVIPRDISNDSIDVLGQDLTNRGGVTHNGMDTVTIAQPAALETRFTNLHTADQLIAHNQFSNGDDGIWVKLVDETADVLQIERVSTYASDKVFTDIETAWNLQFFGGSNSPPEFVTITDSEGTFWVLTLDGSSVIGIDGKERFGYATTGIELKFTGGATDRWRINQAGANCDSVAQGGTIPPQGETPAVWGTLRTYDITVEWGDTTIMAVDSLGNLAVDSNGDYATSGD